MTTNYLPESTFGTDRSGRTAESSRSIEEDATGSRAETLVVNGKEVLDSTGQPVKLLVTFVQGPKKANENDTSDSQQPGDKDAASTKLRVWCSAWEQLEGMDIRVVTAAKGEVEE